MTTLEPPGRTGGLPLAQRFPLLASASLAIALLLAVLDAAGIAMQNTIYPTEDLRQSFVANDLVDLLLGLPLLLISLAMTWRGRLVGLLFWPGALFFVVYNAIAYVYALPSGWPLLLYLLLLTLSVYALIGLVASIDARAVRARLGGKVPERLAGGVLLGLGVLFLLRGVALLVTAQEPLPRTELAVLVADILTVPAWIIGGALLWRKQPLGYVAGMGLLFQASMLFAGLIVFLLVQPVLTGGPLALGDILVIGLLGLICFVPFGLFVRSTARS